MQHTSNRHINNLQAIVTLANKKQISIQLNTTSQKTCKNCQKGGGCQSISFYHWFFEKKWVKLKQPSQKTLKEGDKLSITFSNRLFKRSALALIGLPLSSFLLTVLSSFFIGELGGFLLALVSLYPAFILGKIYTQSQLNKLIDIIPL